MFGCVRAVDASVCICKVITSTVKVTVFSVALIPLLTPLHLQTSDHSVSLFIEATSEKMSLKYLATRPF